MSNVMEKWLERRRNSKARRLSQQQQSQGPVDAKAKWGTAISGSRRQSSMVEDDPFLARFTVTGRAVTEDIPEFTCSDIFTVIFWREFVIDPANSTYYYLSLLVISAVFYNLVFVILRSVYYEINTTDMMPIWMPFDYLCDIIYVFDMVFQSRIGFLEQGLLVRDVKRLAKVYFRSWKFVVDFIIMIPLDFLYLLIGFNAILRMNKCLKVWRLRDFFRLAETHTNFPNLFRVANLILVMVVIIHWNGCIFFLISRSLGFGTDEWVYPDIADPEFASFGKQYVYSFYWSVLTLTTIGDTPMPGTVWSYVYCIICSLMGVLIFATIFGNVGAMINEMDAQRTEFQHKVDAVKRYMEIRNVGGELQDRVIKWFDYTWNNKQSIDDRKALEFLPEKLRAEISIHVHLKTLRRVSIFQDCEPGLLVELVLQLRLQVFSPGDYICRKGDIGREMYIVKRGKLQVVSEDGKTVFVTLSDGAVFGEVSILNISGNKTGNRRTASVRSMGYSDLFCLSKNDLWDALQEYPEAKKLLSERGKQILRKDNLLDEEAARREERRQQNLDKKIELIADAVDDLHADVNKLITKINHRKHSKVDMLSHRESKIESSQKDPVKDELSDNKQTSAPEPKDETDKSKDVQKDTTQE